MHSLDPTVGLRIEEVRTRFERAWQSASPPSIDEYLAGWAGDERLALVRELVRLDFDCRRKAGELITLADYATRFPGFVLDESTQPFQPSDQAETIAAEGSALVAPTPMASLPPGYELRGELGRGGMGVVYLAYHRKLDRLVALKMILAGGHSGTTERQRFATEAKATARLQNSGIVQVFEVGEHDGHPFMALEYCSGGSLDQQLRDQPPTPRQAAEIVRALAEAIQVAHDAQVIHRDLKPQNVLIAADRTLKITDFGLAKKLDEDGQTQTGAIMGTPNYMPPEQARGAGNLGPGVDVYALGAILYAALTGRPPFRGATPMETIHQVLNNEVVPVRQLNPAVPPDLETICHKCLQKEPARRYTTARELADELARFLDGRPILARPVGPFERGYRWVKRNLVVSVLTATVVLVLTAGIIATTALAWVATEARGQAERNAATAQRREGEAITANTALLETTDSLVTTAARSLLRPLALQAQPNQSLPPLSDHEIEALWELASAKDERVRLRFVEVALPNPVWTRQLKDRAPFALQAAVGLNETRRTQVEVLLGKRLQAKETPPEQQVHVAICLADLGNLGRPLAGRTATTLTQAMTRTTNLSVVESLEGLSALSARMDPKEAAEAAATLTQAMTKTTSSYALRSLAQGLSAVAARMEPEEAAQVYGQAAAAFTQAMSKSRSPGDLQSLAEGLSVVAARMEPKEAAQVYGQAAGTLIQAMTRTPDLNALHVLTQGLSAVAARMEAKEAAQACGQAAANLTQAMTTTTDRSALQQLAEDLSAVASRMEAKDAAQACGQAAAILTQAMTRATDPSALRSLAEGLSAVAARMEAKDAAQACGQAAANLTQAMTRTTDPSSLWYLTQGLSSVAARMEAKEAAQACGQAAAILTQAMTTTTTQSAFRLLTQGLSAVVARMEPKEAAEAAATLTQAMTTTTNWHALQALAQGLSAVAVRMKPKEAAATLIQAMTRTTDPSPLLFLTQGLSAVAAGMDPKEAAEAAATLTQAMTKTTGLSALRSLAEGLSAVAVRMEPKKAATTLTQAMIRTTEPDALRPLARGLSAVAARMEAKEAAEAAAILTQAMTTTTDPYALRSLAEGLSAVAVAARMDPKEAAEAAATFTHAMTRTSVPDALPDLAQGLSAVAARMEAKEAAQACGQAAATITQAMTKTTSSYELRSLTQGLLAVAARMEAKEAAQACGQAAAAALTQAMTLTTDWNNLHVLAQNLSAVAAQMEPKEAAEAAATLTQAMTTTRNPSDLRSLAQRLSAVLSREVFPIRQRSVAATVAALATPGTSFGALAWAQPLLEPVPPPLPAQTLVDLLKQPFCVGEPRRLVLEQLSRHYNRPFADQWEFVEYVHQHKVKLDLTTPPAQRGLAAAGSR